MVPPIIALVGGTVIDGNGGPPIEDGVIIVQGKKIACVGEKSTEIPRDARIVRADEKYVMPGMMDANVHLFYVVTPTELIRYEGHYTKVITEGAQVALKNGLTTVFDTWGPSDALARVRDRINRGEEVGSRIFFGGNIIGLGGPTSTDFFPISRSVISKSTADLIDSRWERCVGGRLLWMTAEEVRKSVRSYIRQGSQDFLKYAGSGHANMQFISFSQEVQKAVVEEGHSAGVTVQAHTTSPESLRMAIEAGVDLLQHGDITGAVRMPNEVLDEIAHRQLPCAALFATRRFLVWSDSHGPEGLREINRIKDDNDRRLVAAGVPLLLTTDGGLLAADAKENPLIGRFVPSHDSPTALGDAHFYWLEAAFELGMTPMDALQAATRNVARAYKVDKELGTLEAGKIADLIVLDKSPLQSAANYRTIRLIMKEGEVIDRDALPTQSVLTASTVSDGY